MNIEHPHYYYLVYFPPKDAAKREKIAKALLSFGCVMLNPALWKISSENIKLGLKTVSGFSPIVLKRSREIVPANINFRKHLFDLGSVAIFSYKLPKASSQKRAAVVRILRRVPKIKIGPAFFMIPYLKSSQLTALKGRVILQDTLFEFLARAGIENNKLTHLKIIYPNSHEQLLTLLQSRETLLSAKLTASIRRVTYLANHTDVYDLTKLHKLLSFYRSWYRDLQGVFFFLFNLMDVDLRPNLKMVYNALMLFKRIVEKKSEQVSMAEPV